MLLRCANSPFRSPYHQRYQCRSCFFVAWVGALLVGLGAVAPVSGEIIGDVVRVGYLGQRSPVVRLGQWAPVVVDLTMQNQTAFDGFLRLRQLDRDGDVYVDTVPVHLFGEGGSQKRYTLYTVAANPQRSDRDGFVVELFVSEDGSETEGKLVEVISGGVVVTAMLPVAETALVSDDDYLILSISDRALGKERVLLDPEVASLLNRQVVIAHGAPQVVPNLWIGLEMVDCILWDEADPTRLTDEQQRALVDWMFAGGKLILAAGRTADSIAQAKHLGPLLPVTVGPVRSASDLPDVRQQLLNIVDRDDSGYKRPVAIARCQMIEGVGLRSMLYDSKLDGTVVASRRVGKGQLVFVSAALRDLLDDPEALTDQFFKRLLELRPVVLSVAEDASPYPLIPYFERETAFYRQVGILLALAVLFTVGYVLLSTLGAWRFLSRRKMLKHSWTVLAVLAVIASFVTIAGVQIVHGVGWDVHQLTVVDGVGGSVEAQALSFIGVSTATHTRLDVWLPKDATLDKEPRQTTCTLRPLLDWRELVTEREGFTDPARYTLQPATAELHDVPFRATLKQFEGRWRGMLRGTIASSLSAEYVVVPKKSGGTESAIEFVASKGSWIRNDLGVDLKHCFLVMAERDVVVPQRFTTFSPRGVKNFSSILVIPLGELLAGNQIDIFARCYADTEGRFKPAATRESWRLGKMQQSWGRQFITLADETMFGGGVPDRGLADYQDAVMIATLNADIDPRAFRRSALVGYHVFSCAHMRSMDIADLVTTRTALFVGFSDEAGPARIRARKRGGDYELLEPSRSRTVYRFLLPVTEFDAHKPSIPDA